MLNKEKGNLVEALGWRHRCLDSQAANVLPSLLQQRDEVVDRQHDVGDQLVLSHLDVSDSNTHTQDLLQLELDGGLDFVDLTAKIFVVGDWGWEFTSCEEEMLVKIIQRRKRIKQTLGKTGTQETGNLLDQGVGSDESIVLACELLDQLLVLVELLQVISGHGVNTTVLGTIDIVLITENAIHQSAFASHNIYFRLRGHTRCSCLGGERLGDGRFRRNACHVGDHSS